MRVVGTLFVLAACAAIQLPWFSCHSDCQQAFLPVWDLDVHHCHDEAAHDPSPRACPCCPAPDAAPRGATGDGPHDGDPDHDHDPGDHELQLRSSRRPVPAEAHAPGSAPAWLAVPAAPESAAPAPAASPGPHLGVFDTGPPDRLASVRLLL